MEDITMSDNNINLTPVEYMRILETNLDQSMEIARLRKALSEEYAYAESILGECDRLGKEVARLETELNTLKSAPVAAEG
jgi:cell shape-determining protein MreC